MTATKPYYFPMVIVPVLVLCLRLPTKVSNLVDCLHIDERLWVPIFTSMALSSRKAGKQDCKKYDRSDMHGLYILKGWTIINLLL